MKNEYNSKQTECWLCDHPFHDGWCKAKPKPEYDEYDDGLCHCEETCQYENSGFDGDIENALYCSQCGILLCITDFDPDFHDLKFICIECIKNRKNGYMGCPKSLSGKYPSLFR